MKDILIISNYYPPEKGAAANRIEQLALKLHQNNYAVSVLCPLGNYPKGALFPEYKGRFTVVENRQNIAVKRLWIYPSVSKNIFKRTLSVLSFSTMLFCTLLFKKTPQKVIVQSPPLLLSFVAVLALWITRKTILLNVSDLWPTAAIELKAIKEGGFSHKISLLFERFIYSKATLILGQSNEIISHIHQQYPEKKCYLYRNFPNHQIKEIKITSNLNEPIKLFYAGLLGVAQGVYELCQKIKLSGLHMELHIFGDGAEKTEIETYIENNPLKKIIFHGMLERHIVHEKIASFDIAVIPLQTRIYGSVPSKIFEYGSLGFPMLYFGGGEGEAIVRENQLGWVADVGDFESLNEALCDISSTGKIKIQQMKRTVYQTAQKEFDLEQQIKKMITEKIL